MDIYFCQDLTGCIHCLQRLQQRKFSFKGEIDLGEPALAGGLD